MEFSSAAANSRLTGSLTGKIVGRFIVGERLGKGGMGEVYRAEDTRLKRAVALKRLAPSIAADPEYRRRFQEEVERASRFSDSHVAAVYDVIEHGEDTLLVMEFVEGQTLRQRLREPMSLEQFLDMATQCANALVAAHQRGIVHCDIKPENIMLTREGQVKILDFGVAKYMPRSDQSSTLDSSRTLGGTPAYMAPEVLLQKGVDGRADIFSLSIVLYEALTGQHPFLAESFVATSQRILQESPAPIRIFNPEVPEALERVVGRAMAKDPAQRYLSARDLADALRQIATETVPGKVLPQPRERAVAGKNKKYIAAGLAITIALILAAGLQLHRLRSWLSANRSVSQIHMAVLPFTPGASDANSKAFSDGLTETLAVKLTQLSGSYPLAIVPPSEILGEGITTIEQARKGFGVKLVLVGALHQSGNRVRVTYSLVDAQTMRQVSGDVFTADANDVFTVEDRVVDKVIEMLGLELGQNTRASLAVHGTQEPAAHDYYLRGRGYMQDYHKPENLEAAIAVFDHALERDPNYALAYAGLGDAYWNKYEITGDRQWFEKAFNACQRAVDLAADAAETRTCLGTVYNGSGQYEKAITEFQQAVEADVTSDDAIRGLAFAYEKLGRTSEAERTFQKAIEIRPQYWAGYEALGYFYSSQARYQESAQQFERAISLAPDDPHGYRSLGGIYIYMGRYAQAIDILRKAIELYPTTQAYSNLGVAYFNLRNFEDSISAYEHACTEQATDYIACGNLARSYYWAQDRRAQAPRYYQRAIRLADERLKVNPQDGDLHIMLANYYAMLNDKQKSLQHLREALTLHPEDPEFLLIAAIVHNQFGEPVEAISWVKKAVDRGYSAAEIRSAPELDNLRDQPDFQSVLKSQ